MNSKTKKSKPRAKKEMGEPGKAVPKEWRPSGRAPEAAVASRHGVDIISRAGKGFSKGELSGASLPGKLASAWGVPTDIRRRSVIEANVESLRKWYSPPAKATGKPARAAAAPAEGPTTPEKPAKKRAVRKKKTKG